MIDERTSIDWLHEITDQLDWHWQNHVRPHLDDLTDEELHWEPVPGCWGVRPREQATTEIVGGAGAWVAEWAMPEPVPPPVTTIAWRLGHLTVGCFGARAASHMGGPPIDYFTYDYPSTAERTLADLDETYSRWIAGVKALAPDDLARRVGPAEGQWADLSVASLILHINREAIHHGAECLVLRDLYRSRSTS